MLVAGFIAIIIHVGCCFYTLSAAYLKINGVCHRYEIRMKQLKKKMNKDIDW
jgi:hypothetical protein